MTRRCVICENYRTALASLNVLTHHRETRITRILASSLSRPDSSIQFTRPLINIYIYIYFYFLLQKEKEKKKNQGIAILGKIDLDFEGWKEAEGGKI